MTSFVEEKFETLVDLIKDVKPGLIDRTVALDHSMVDDLGFDSLDILQLSRKIRRNMQVNFDMDRWDETADKHRRSVQSILENIAESADS